MNIIEQRVGGPAIASVARVSRARSYVHHTGMVWIHCDHDSFEYYVDVAIGAPTRYRGEILAQLRAWGLEPDPEMTDVVAEGMQRIIFSPIVPLTDEEINWLAGAYEEEEVA